MLNADFCTMKYRLFYLLGLLIFWLIFFVSFKLVFLFYMNEISFQSDLIDWLKALGHGLKMDLSMGAYFSAIPFILVALSTLGAEKVIAITLKYFNYLLIVLACVICTIDLELFYAWGFHFDATPLMYLHSPTEMMASAGASPIMLLLFIWAMTVALAGGCYHYFLHATALKFNDTRFYYALPILILTSALIIPIRGGLQLAPINQSSVYFSSNNFNNQVAVNPVWNLFHSLDNKGLDKDNPYQYLHENQAQALVKAQYMRHQDSTVSIINNPKPNVLIIVWESFTAKTVGSLNGIKGITPKFDSLTQEGLLFTNFYASADRSDKGLVALLSGYPAQPKQSIITTPKKTAAMPSLSKSFKESGYHTSFYYGGELEFANIKSYLLQANFDQLIGKNEFDEKDWNSKWGAHDHVVFKRWINDLNQKEEPFFSTLFTLSSHEPFEVAYQHPEYGGKTDEQSKFLNSIAYTDQSLFDFISEAKKQDWYNNTLIIVVADHGHRLPNQSQHFETDKFHIPMLWLGGALDQKGQHFEKIGSQTDLASTLLAQLKIPSKQFEWSKNLFDPQSPEFAIYVFNDGMGLVKPGISLAFDNKSRKYIFNNPDQSEQDLTFAKAHLQSSYQDYLNK